jgi:hypothetical protein
MPTFQIKCRITGAIRFEGEFGSLKLCVEAGVRDGASLAGASLTHASLVGASLVGASLAGASLTHASLVGASLAGASLVGASLVGAMWREGIKLRGRGIAKEATRSDGYRFMLLDTEAEGRWRVHAGCRFFTMPEAWQHWKATRDNTPLGEETFDILALFEHHAERVGAAP